METLVEEGQAHLFAGWPASGEGDADKRRLLAQLQHLDANTSRTPASCCATPKRVSRQGRGQGLLAGQAGHPQLPPAGLFSPPTGAASLPLPLCAPAGVNPFEGCVPSVPEGE